MLEGRRLSTSRRLDIPNSDEKDRLRVSKTRAFSKDSMPYRPHLVYPHHNVRFWMSRARRCWVTSDCIAEVEFAVKTKEGAFATAPSARNRPRHRSCISWRWFTQKATSHHHEFSHSPFSSPQLRYQRTLLESDTAPHRLFAPTGTLAPSSLITPATGKLRRIHTVFADRKLTFTSFHLCQYQLQSPPASPPSVIQSF